MILAIYLLSGLALATYVRVSTKEKAPVGEHLVILLLWPVILLAVLARTEL